MYREKLEHSGTTMYYFKGILIKKTKQKTSISQGKCFVLLTYRYTVATVKTIERLNTFRELKAF